MLIVMGDLNAKVGEDQPDWKDVMGKYGYGKPNARGEKLLNFCAANDLHITNTMFKQSKSSRQWTWESPDQKTHNKIDFIMISNKWKNCVNNSRSFPSADVGSDHQLVIANIRLRFKAKPKPNYPKRYDIFKLKNTNIRQNYEIEIGGRFAPHC
jgi:endonuclease/exonuclease/phosphatase family metal-dependent hydrolase